MTVCQSVAGHLRLSNDLRDAEFRDPVAGDDVGYLN